MAHVPPPEPALVRTHAVARARARLAAGEWPDADAVALAILAWTCPPYALAS
jgi:hypothetical protein